MEGDDYPGYNDKYIVLRRDDIRLTHVEHEVVEFSGEFNSEQIIQDAVVIRTRDVFAGAGLMAYAGAVETAIELMNFSGLVSIGGVNKVQLRALADFFHDKAHEAQESAERRVPD